MLARSHVDRVIGWVSKSCAHNQQRGCADSVTSRYTSVDRHMTTSARCARWHSPSIDAKMTRSVRPQFWLITPIASRGHAVPRDQLPGWRQLSWQLTECGASSGISRGVRQSAPTISYGASAILNADAMTSHVHVKPLLTEIENLTFIISSRYRHQ